MCHQLTTETDTLTRHLKEPSDRTEDRNAKNCTPQNPKEIAKIPRQFFKLTRKSNVWEGKPRTTIETLIVPDIQYGSVSIIFILNETIIFLTKSIK